jgi:hypothetical protein
LVFEKSVGGHMTSSTVPSGDAPLRRQRLHTLVSRTTV